jgi:hypothetical protein
MAAGLDSIVKFFSITENKETLKTDIKVEYKIKVPSEIFAFDNSYDGNHFALGLNDGTLIIKSKMLEELEEIDEEQKLFDEILKPTYKSSSKNYKYFYRGQYVAPDPQDLLSSLK